jgi:hypothetical protein
VLEELAEYGTHRPHVDAGAVTTGAEKELRRAIPARCNIVRVELVWWVECAAVRVQPGLPKICNLEEAVACEQEVGRLQVLQEARSGRP